MMDKEEKLRSIIGSYAKVAIAFSGGVDSTLLAAVAKRVLGSSGVELITASLHMTPSWERSDAVEFASFLGLSHRVIRIDELSLPAVVQNPVDRCYHCKKIILGHIIEQARRRSCDVVFDGSNKDDDADYRPGLKAVGELGVVSPLALAGLKKKEIRELSTRFELPTATKPSGACLGSRIPYGEKITAQLLRQIEAAEEGIRRLGFEEMRVRVHGDCARLEVSAQRLDEAWRMREALTDLCKAAGFSHVALDLTGYLSGSLNTSLKKRGII